MRSRALVGLLLVLLLLAGCADGSGDPADPTRPTSGGRLPDVTLAALEGDGSLDLGELRGPVVVNLWASWCAPCRDELPVYAEFAERHQGVVDVVGIDTEETSPEKARDLARETGVGYPLYADPDGLLRAIGLPKVVLVGADGDIAFEQYVEIDDLAQLEDLAREHLDVDL